MLNKYYSENGVYMLPWHNPNQKRSAEEEKKMMKEMEGKPSAMVFYSKSASMDFTAMMVKGLLYALIVSLMVAWVLQKSILRTFSSRFIVGFSFAVFGVLTGVLTEMNWWGPPMHFAKAAIIDILGGWALSSAWLAWYMKGDS